MTSPPPDADGTPATTTPAEPTDLTSPPPDADGTPATTTPAEPTDLTSPLDSEPRPIDITDSSSVSTIGGFEFVPVTPGLLGNPVLLRAFVGLLVGLTILAWPSRTDTVLAVLVGLTFVWMSSISAVQAVIGQRRRRHLFVSIGGLFVGIVMIIDIRDAQANLGQLIGMAMIVVAIRDRPHRDDARRHERIARSIALITAGALLLVFPNQVLAVATTIVVLTWIVLSAITIAATLDARSPAPSGYATSVTIVTDWLDGMSKSVATRRDLAERLTFSGPEGHTRVFRFFVLMFFASVIASMGVITDSTAVVIGAMLIAPLMTPLMGMAMSLGMGWPNRLGRAALIAAGGILLAIATGALLGVLAPTVIDTTLNSQILSRSQPNALDLVIAVAAGGAGAYGLSRPDVSDALPGVAIAISLVPPLAVVGIAYSQADLSAGSGAMLLFGTNALAILLVGGATFIATGVVPLRRVADSQQRVATSLAAVIALAAMVVGALLLNGQQAASALLVQSRVQTTVSDWLSDADDFRVQAIATDRATVTVDVVGPRFGLPDVEQLADALTEAMGRETSVEVRVSVEALYSAGPDS